MNLFTHAIDENLQALIGHIEALPLAEKVEALNTVRAALHAVSPFAGEPVDCVLWVPAEHVDPNDYNPNAVAPPEMRLLELSIVEDGYTQPAVVWRDGQDEYELVDGEHRCRVGKESKRVRQRVHGYLPVSVINDGRADTPDRMAATIRHNRARGVHGVVPMKEIVAAMLKAGWPDDQVARHLGMDADELLRFKQATGLPELFKNGPYSRAWE